METPMFNNLGLALALIIGGMLITPAILVALV
jgi:hypothetical protein